MKQKKTKCIIFHYVSNNFKTVKAVPFTHNGINLHLRKDYLYVGDKKTQWIISESESGSIFCSSDTIKSVLINLDLIFEEYTINEIKQRIVKQKALQFDKMRQRYKL